MKRYCTICGSSHEPDVPCYDATEQLKRDMGIRPRKGGSGELTQKTIWLMVGLFVVVLLAGSLFFWLVL